MYFFKLFICIVLFIFLMFKGPALISFLFKLPSFFKWKYVDVKKYFDDKKKGVSVFKPFGLKMFCGRQGSGKTIGMVFYLFLIRKFYPKAMIYTNFDYKFQNGPLNSLNDLLQIRNGENGVVFALDEIQNEFSCLSSKDFPETLLSQITQQRKQRICILATSQIFMRVAKPLREQCFEVIDCRTFFGRWTSLRCYDADDYNSIVDKLNNETKFKLPKKWKRSFIQTDDLRNSYDTYSIVKRISRDGFVSKIKFD